MYLNKGNNNQSFIIILIPQDKLVGIPIKKIKLKASKILEAKYYTVRFMRILSFPHKFELYHSIMFFTPLK